MSNRNTKLKQFSQIPQPKPPKRDRPWIVEERFTDEYVGEMSSWNCCPDWVNDEWRVRGSYLDESIAGAAAEQFGKQITGGHMEYRVRHREDGDECLHEE